MDLEKHVWSLVLDVVERGREADRRIIRSGRPVLPSILAFSYCLECDELTYCIAPLASDMEITRALFPIFVFAALSRTGRCGGCGRSTLPIGYSYSSEAWNLKVDEMDGEEVELYRRVLGTIAKHPKRREVYLTSVVTVIGKKVLAEEIIRGEGRVRLKRMKMPENVDVTGRFVLPLPRINLNTALKEKRRFTPQF